MGKTFVDNIVLENNPRLSIVGGPNFSTTIVRASGGWRSSQSNWQSPLWKYKMKYIEVFEDFHEIITFWLGRKGPAYAFLIKDHADCSVTSKTGIVKKVGNDYQLMKKYPDSIRPFNRTITRPIKNSVILGDVNGEVDFKTGIVTGISEETTWAGQFYVPVAFMSDSMDYNFRPSSQDGYMEWDVEVEEVQV